MDCRLFWWKGETTNDTQKSLLPSKVNYKITNRAFNKLPKPSKPKKYLHHPWYKKETHDKSPFHNVESTMTIPTTLQQFQAIISNSNNPGNAIITHFYFTKSPSIYDKVFVGSGMNGLTAIKNPTRVFTNMVDLNLSTK